MKVKTEVVKPDGDLTLQPGDIVSGKEVFTLTKPLMINGNKHLTLNLNFDDLTGESLERIQTQLVTKGISFNGPSELNKIYLMHLVAAAAGVNYEILKTASFRDVSSMTMLAQSFLIE